jgi:sugar/nucleoside kinase (ribokinase family)
MGTINAIRPEEVNDDLLSTARHLHHGSFYLHTRLRPAIPYLFQRARRLGLTTSLDTNWDPEETWDGGLVDALRWTDIFMPNDQEAMRISRQEGLAQAADVFRQQGARIVAIKAGDKGAWGFAAGGAWEQPVSPVSGGDSIGAGDSFDAGFLAGWLRGYPLEKCLQIASACGRSVANQIGGLAGQLNWEDIIYLTG